MDKKTMLLLSLIFASCAVQFISFLSADKSDPSWDESWHAMISLNIYNHLRGTGYADAEKAYPVLAYAINFYPPFFHIMALPLYLLFGAAFHTALLSNILFLIILIISSYLVGRKLKDERAGLLLAFISATVLQYNSLMRQYLTDFALVSMVSLGYALLLYSEDFSDLGYSILFGFVSGLGMLTKTTYVGFLMVPVFFSLIGAVKKGKHFINVISCAFAFLLMVSLWYTPVRLSQVLVTTNQFGRLEGDPTYATLSGAAYYMVQIINGFSFFYFLIFAFSAAILVREAKKHMRKRASQQVFQILLNIIVIYIIFTVLSNKDPRYIVPVLFFMSAIVALWVSGLSKNRAALIAAVIAVGSMQALASNSGFAGDGLKIGDIFVLPSAGYLPGRSAIDIEKGLSAIGKKESFSLCVIAESERLNDVNIPYYSFRNNYPVVYMAGNGCDPSQFDYVITGPIEKTWRSGLFEKSMASFESIANNYLLIYNESGMGIYRNKYR